MFGISESLNWYSWFIHFYIISIFLLPFGYKYIEKYPKSGWIICIACSYVVKCLFIKQILPGIGSENPMIALFNTAQFFPLIVVGYMCAKWNSEGKIPNWFEGRNRIVLAITTIIGILVLNSLHFPLFGFCLEAFYTPFLVFAIVGISNSLKLRYITKGLIKIGELSMYMWFFHAVFFTESVNAFTKNLVFEPIHSFPYTFIITLILTYIGSYIIQKLLKPIIKRIR